MKGIGLSRLTVTENKNKRRWGVLVVYSPEKKGLEKGEKLCASRLKRGEDSIGPGSAT